MKIAVILESDELEKYTSYRLICGAFANHMSWSSLYLSQKIALGKAGYDEEKYNSFSDLRTKANEWALKYLPDYSTIPLSELARWQELRGMAEIVMGLKK